MSGTTAPNQRLTAEAPELIALLMKHWGYPAFLPNQAEAVDNVLAGQDSLVILPTGGGKSMCYQLPALALPGTAIVVSPLLSLMKDQVDALTASGVPAGALNSSLSAEERRDVTQRLRQGELKLLYVSPEGLATPYMVETLRDVAVSFIAVDEAHCVSQWGHDYRADYRNLGALRQWFPDVAMHGFTATATEAVRQDVIASLGLRQTAVVVGSFDRPNLTYRATYRRDLMAQLEQVLERHKGEAGIVYCISRAEVEQVAAALSKRGHKALPYHAGLGAEVRRKHQEAFANEQVDLIVATVAFGMGIDRSNVRFVAHAGLPRSIENYQQEAGRAGRDRLDAECILFFGGQDLMAWKRILGAPATEYDRAALEKLNEVYRFARSLTCRHRFLVSYFGEDYPHANCGACDVCFGEHAELDEAVLMSQKILSCVARVRESFGGRHVAEVLKGAKHAKILQHGHDQLSTHGLLAEYHLNDIGDWIDQLVMQGFLVREGEWQVLHLTESGRRLMRGDDNVRLSAPRAVDKPKKAKRTGGGGVELAGPEEELFQALRAWRRELASERGVPPYVILTDATLVELARERPASHVALMGIKGIGESKARAFGEQLLVLLADHSAELGLAQAEAVAAAPAPVESARASTGQQAAAFTAFRKGLGLEDVAALTGRAASTVEGYLLEFIREEGVDSPEPWLAREVYDQVGATAREVKAERLRPIHEALGGAIDYGQIRIALAIMANQHSR
ncbi:MAG: recQ [Cyanobacteria bacterium RYN_339]|nr:recQ [Cyanobacteria bacterium RYN_339]